MCTLADYEHLELDVLWRSWLESELDWWHHDYLPIPEGATVLDVGAGCGETVQFYLLHGAAGVVAVEGPASRVRLCAPGNSHGKGADRMATRTLTDRLLRRGIRALVRRMDAPPGVVLQRAMDTDTNGMRVESRIIGIEIRLRDAFGVQEEIAMIPCDVRFKPSFNAMMEQQLVMTIHTSGGDLNPPPIRIPAGL